MQTANTTLKVYDNCEALLISYLCLMCWLLRFIKQDGMSITGAGILRYGRRLRQTQDGRVSPIFTETGRMVLWFQCKLDCTSKVSFTRHLRREELWHHSDTAATSVSGCCRSVYRVLYLVVDPICICLLYTSRCV